MSKHWEHSKEEIIRIAKLYHEEEWSEQEISDHPDFHYSRATINRMLKYAKNQGWYKVRVIATSSAHEILRIKEELLHRYPALKTIHISPERYFINRPDDEATSNDLTAERMLNVAVMAAKVFSARLKELEPGSVVAVGPGEALRLTVMEMQHEVLPHLHVVPTNGYLYERNTALSANEVGALLAQRLNCQFHWLPCIGIMHVDHEEIVAELPVIGETLREWIPKTSLVLTGVRDFREEDLKRYEGFFPKAVREYAARVKSGELPEPLGLLCDHPFTRNGRWNKGSKSEKVIGLDLSEIERLAIREGSNVILVATSETEKRTMALEAALERGYCSILVTDEATAHQVLMLDKK